jgi:hypothetical protein
MTLTSRSRIRALALAGLLAGVFAVLGAAAPGAHAVTAFTCGGSDTVGYSPAITNTPATVTFNVLWVLGPCLNVLHPLELRTGSSPSTHAVPGAACTNLHNGSSGTRTINWSNGHSTTYTYNQTASDVAGLGKVIVQQGTITSGDFDGDAIIVEQVLEATQFLSCGTTGVTSAVGTVEVTIVG